MNTSSCCYQPKWRRFTVIDNPLHFKWVTLNEPLCDPIYSKHFNWAGHLVGNYWIFYLDAWSLSQVTVTHLKIESRRFHLRVPILQMSWSALAQMVGYQILAPQWPPGRHAPLVGISSESCSSLVTEYMLHKKKHQSPWSIFLQIMETSTHGSFCYPLTKWPYLCRWT